VTYRIEPMNAADFEDMASWRYEPPYEFYDSNVEPVLNPERFFAVRDDSGALVGHYYFQMKGDALEYGIGLRPELTGRGLGLVIFRAGLDFGKERFAPASVTLAVAAFNARAISVYERGGFRETGRHVRTFERFGEVEFVDMVLAE
jgi:ribosomal-protein-alanine N-acetyltransferase